MGFDQFGSLGTTASESLIHSFAIEDLLLGFMQPNDSLSV